MYLCLCMCLMRMCMHVPLRTHCLSMNGFGLEFQRFYADKCAYMGLCLCIIVSVCMCVCANGLVASSQHYSVHTKLHAVQNLIVCSVLAQCIGIGSPCNSDILQFLLDMRTGRWGMCASVRCDISTSGNDCRIPWTDGFSDNFPWLIFIRFLALNWRFCLNWIWQSVPASHHRVKSARKISLMMSYWLHTAQHLNTGHAVLKK